MRILDNKKLLFALLLTLLIELGLSIWYLKTKGFSNYNQQQLLKIERPVTLLLDPSRQELSTEEEFQVNIILDTNDKQAVGADVILEYDSKALEILTITPGSIFSFYPEPKIGKEKVLISGIGQVKETFSGRGVLAQLSLKGKIQGKTELKFNFEPHQTDDSNVAIKNNEEDGLEKIQNGSYYFR